MHELAVCMALVDQVRRVARERGGTVQSVRVGVGPLSGVEPGLLATAYSFASAGTEADGSRLQLESTPVEVRCHDCAAESTARAHDLRCPACGSWHTDLARGDELLLLQVELAVEA